MYFISRQIYIATDKYAALKNAIFNKIFKNTDFPPSFSTQNTRKHQFLHRLSVYNTIKNIFLMLNEPLK